MGIITQARKRLDDGIHFRRDCRGYWYPDLVVDQIAIFLLQNEYGYFKVPTTKDADEILDVFSNKTWVVFDEKCLVQLE